MPLSKTDQKKLSDNLDSIEQELRNVNVSGDRQPVSNVHSTISEIREDLDLESDTE